MSGIAMSCAGSLREFPTGHRATLIRSIVADDGGPGLPEAAGDPGPDATRGAGHKRDTFGQVEEVALRGRDGLDHRGSGFGPVAVTSRCGIQSRT